MSWWRKEMNTDGANTRFIIGDVVALNSGGSWMTVTKTFEEEGGLVHTVWMDDTGKCHRDCFDPKVLCGNEEEENNAAE